ncbi:MAG: efflux RND transporter permease subunit [Acidobacteriota bacterium]
MWDALIRWSLRNRSIVLGLAGLLILHGTWTATQLDVEVLPEITAPTVTLLVDAHGMAPDEVEALVTVPLESALNGTPGLRRLRSSSGIGSATIWAEFEWDVDPLAARQVVSERLQVARASLPPDVPQPLLAPQSSIMGEIMFLALVPEGEVDPMELRDLAQWELRRRLLGVPGVANVSPIGGDLRQVQVVLDPVRLEGMSIGHRQVMEALEGSSENAPGGFLISGHQEYLIRGIGRAATLEELSLLVVGRLDDHPVLLGDVAEVRFGPALARGAAAVNGRPAVVLAVQKQPAADTLELTARIDDALDGLEKTLPEGVTLYRKGFRQARFIEVALGNVSRHVLESAIFVAVLLALFLANWRTTFISLTALPLSLLAGVEILALFGASMNTMTLGGFAIAIGALVDDAIIDVENVYRRLRQRAAGPEDDREPLLEIVFRASSEIRGSIVHATAIIVVVFLPLFFLSGLEGRLLVPLGMAYVASLVASLLVAVTVTPVLCFLLLKNAKPHGERSESLVVRTLKDVYRPVLDAALKGRWAVALLALLGTVLSVMVILSFGRSFLPGFNEGSFTIAAATVPGAPLIESERAVSRLEDSLLELDFIESIVRRTGRGEQDEHSMDVQFSEMEITVDSEMVSTEEAAAAIREVAHGVAGLAVSVGQPIGHRIEHMLSGVKTSIAVKVFGDDLPILRSLAQQVESAMSGVPGVVDLAIEPQTDVPQVVVRPRFAALAQLGMSPGELAEFTETAFLGHVVGQWWERDRAVDLVVRYPERYRSDLTSMKATPIDVDGEIFTTLGDVARVEKTLGPNLVNRENVRRRIVVMANTAGRDIRSIIDDVQARIDSDVDFPEGYYVEFGGEFESEARASKTILALGSLAIVAMVLLLWLAFQSLREALLTLAALPLSLMGGAAAVWLTGGVLSIASMVGFITLFGIATRNGILLLTHYRHLMEHEGEDLQEAIRRGSLERLSPVLMTALASGLALVPIALALGEPGNEIQAPMALVILGGLVSSTFLTLIVVPVLYSWLGRSRRAAD